MFHKHSRELGSDFQNITNSVWAKTSNLRKKCALLQHCEAVSSVFSHGYQLTLLGCTAERGTTFFKMKAKQRGTLHMCNTLSVSCRFLATVLAISPPHFPLDQCNHLAKSSRPRNYHVIFLLFPFFKWLEIR